MATAPKPSQGGEKTAYQLATEKLSPAVREQLYRQFTLAKVGENDPLWAVVGAIAGLVQSSLEQEAPRRGASIPVNPLMYSAPTLEGPLSQKAIAMCALCTVIGIIIGLTAAFWWCIAHAVYVPPAFLSGHYP